MESKISKGSKTLKKSKTRNKKSEDIMRAFNLKRLKYLNIGERRDALC